MDTRLNKTQQSVPSIPHQERAAADYENGLTPVDAVAKRVSMEVNRSKDLNLAAATKIDVRNLDFYYGSKQALFGLSLHILDHQATALIGPSGCGKIGRAS